MYYFCHSLSTDDNSLTVHDVDYLQDSGVFMCVAHNNAGTSQASATITIHNPNDTDIQGKMVLACDNKLSCVMKKPDFCLGKNKGTDQLCSNCTAE